MKAQRKAWIITLGLTFTWAGLLGAQPGNAPRFDPYRQTPEQRKAARDDVVRRVGESSLPFTRKYGDPGIVVLQKLSPEAGQRLVALDAQGALQGKIPDPKRLLGIIARYGDEVSDWAVNNAALLAEPQAFELFMREPQDYVYDLRDLRTDMATARQTQGESFSPAQQLGHVAANQPPWLAIALIIVMLVIGIGVGRAWRMRMGG